MAFLIYIIHRSLLRSEVTEENAPKRRFPMTTEIRAHIRTLNQR